MLSHIAGRTQSVRCTPWLSCSIGRWQAAVGPVLACAVGGSGAGCGCPANTISKYIHTAHTHSTKYTRTCTHTDTDTHTWQTEGGERKRQHAMTPETLVCCFYTDIRIYCLRREGDYW